MKSCWGNRSRLQTVIEGEGLLKGLVMAGAAPDLKSGVANARAALQSGAAARLLETYKKSVS